MKKNLIIIFVLLILLVNVTFAQDISVENFPLNYPYTLAPVSTELQNEWRDKCILALGEEWASLMSDKFTGFIQYAAKSGLSEKKDMFDYTEAVKVGDKFLEENGYLFGMEEQRPQCIDVAGSENPELGYVWLYFSEQIYNEYPVIGTRVMMKVDYPGVVIESRVRWYPDIIIPEAETLGEDDIRLLIKDLAMNYQGKGGQELLYIVKESDVKEITKVIFPVRTEDELKFYIAWKISIDKEEVRDAWTIYLEAYSGDEIYTKKNFK